MSAAPAFRNLILLPDGKSHLKRLFPSFSYHNIRFLLVRLLYYFPHMENLYDIFLIIFLHIPIGRDMYVTLLKVACICTFYEQGQGVCVCSTSV